MHYQNQPGGLPVQVFPPNQGAFINPQSLPFNPPFVVPVQIHPNLAQQNLVPALTGGVILYLQNQAQRNQLRSFLFNLLSSNNWGTQEFQGTVTLAGQLLDFYMGTQGHMGMQPQQALEMACTEACMFTMVDVVGRYQHQLGQFIDDRVANDLNITAAKRAQTLEQLQRFFQGMQQNMAPMQQYNAAPMVTTMGGGNMPGWMGAGSPAPAVPAHLAYGGVGGGTAYLPQNQYQQPHRPQYNHMAHRGGGVHGGSGMYEPVQQVQATGVGMGTGLKPKVRRQTNQELTMEPGGERPTLALHDSGEQALLVESTVRQNERDGIDQGHQFRAGRTTGFPSNQGPFKAGQQDVQPSDALPGQTVQPAQQTFVAQDSWPKFVDPSMPYEGMVLEDGTEMRPAVKSEWKVTSTAERPYRLIYNPDEVVPFHLRRPDGTVLERFEPRIAEMEYLDNELNPALRKAERERREKADDKIVAPNWPLAERMRQITDKSAAVMAPAEEPVAEGEDTKDDLATSLEPKTLDTVAIVHSRAEAALKLAMIQSDKEINPSLTSPVEFYFEEITPVMGTSEEFTAVRTMEGCTSFDELFAKFNEYDGVLSTEVKAVLDKRLTSSLVEALQKSMGLEDWNIDSFDADYHELLKVLGEKFPGSTTLTDALNTFAPEIIGRAVSVLVGDGLKQYLAETKMDLDGREGMAVLAFRDRCSITQVPWDFVDLRIRLNGGGMIPETAMPQLHAAVKALFDRTLDYPVTWAHRYIQTGDKKRIEAVRGYLGGEDTFLLFDAK